MESYFGAICGDATAADEVDDPDEAQPPTLSAAVINAMQAPHESLATPRDAKPWVARDQLRRNCVRLLARRGVVDALIVTRWLLGRVDERRVSALSGAIVGTERFSRRWRPRRTHL
mmetsp:Transcript_4236/g.13240  ORF Transcript_4236/g.13240 Transcript_4236/m.13240 type:complete len:116 (+) Transcript_4236:1117-1464(+)